MSNREPIKAVLTGGNPRALARTEEVVTLVLGNRTHLKELYACLLEEDETIRMRASDALEKVCRGRPAWLQAYVPQLLTEVAAIEQASVQWHLAQILGEVELTPSQRAAACRILKRNLTEKKDWIVVNYSMETLAKFSRDDGQLRTQVLAMLKGLLSDPHKSTVTRARKLIAALSAISLSHSILACIGKEYCHVCSILSLEIHPHASFVQTYTLSAVSSPGMLLAFEACRRYTEGPCEPVHERPFALLLVTVKSFQVPVVALLSPGEVNCHQDTHRGAEPWDSTTAWRAGEPTPATRRGRAPIP
jgi:hypothetical protein